MEKKVIITIKEDGISTLETMGFEDAMEVFGSVSYVMQRHLISNSIDFLNTNKKLINAANKKHKRVNSNSAKGTATSKR
jgi:hypothetical protein